MDKNNQNPKVGFSVGDLNGIGIEILFKIFEDQRLLELITPVIFCNIKMLSFIKKTYESPIVFTGINSLDQIIDGKINVINVWEEPFDLKFGQLDQTAGKHAVISLKFATQALKNKNIDVLVTAPINKSNTYSDDFPFPGHTEYLNQELIGDSLMFMISENIKVALMTDHLPLNEVSQALTVDLIKNKINLLNQSLKMDFCISKPKIAVLGLNPHSGDNGVIGKEDDLIIKPIIKELFENGVFVFGPYASDGFFGNQMYKNFDAVLACYHDQGLIPYKTLSFGQGVNFTAGLDFIRTSPDHGTAYDIVGKNLANESSMLQAIYAAIDIFENRKMYKENNKNVLKFAKYKPSSKME
jgi:4-hydroxythreonine-4-phosphate dehydrogenase